MASSESNPPDMPKGWLALWDSNYKEWYYVNEATGKSQWTLPEGAKFRNKHAPPEGPPPPPAYEESTNSQRQSQPQAQNKYNKHSEGNQKQFGSYPQQAYPQQAYPQQAYPQQAYPQQAYPQQAYPPQQSYGAYNNGGGAYSGYGAQPQQQPIYAQQQAASRGGSGWGKFALGAGAGVLGGMLVNDIVEDKERDAYMDGVYDANNGDYGGYDDGGYGDFDGGDF